MKLKIFLYIYFRCADDFPVDETTQIPMVSSCLNIQNDTAETCHNFQYDLFMGYESLTSELNWICDNAWKLTLGQSMFFVGSVVGSLVFGILADVVGELKYFENLHYNIIQAFLFTGRLPILIIANMIAMLGNVLTIFGTDLITFSLFRFISGLATDSNFVMMYILGK